MFVGKLRAPIKTSDGKSVVGFFRHVSYTHLGTFGLGSGTNRRLIPIREARYFFGLGMGTCNTKYFYRNCCAPKTSDGKSAVGIFRLVSFMHLGTFFGFCWSMEDKNLYVKCRHAAKTGNSEYEIRAQFASRCVCL